MADGFSKGRRGRTGRRTNGGALPGPRASRRLDRFQAGAETPPTRDDNSCRGPRRRLRRPLGCRRLVRWLDSVGSGISTRFPLISRTRAHTTSMFRSDRLTGVRLPLTRNPRPRRCLPRSRSNSCYYHQDILD